MDFVNNRREQCTTYPTGQAIHTKYGLVKKGQGRLEEFIRLRQYDKTINSRRYEQAWLGKGQASLEVSIRRLNSILRYIGAGSHEVRFGRGERI